MDKTQLIIDVLRTDGRYRDWTDHELVEAIEDTLRTGRHTTGIEQDVHGAISILKRLNKWPNEDSRPTVQTKNQTPIGTGLNGWLEGFWYKSMKNKTDQEIQKSSTAGTILYLHRPG